MNRWYVIKTKPKKEKEVYSRLISVGYELFLPQLEGIVAPLPLFPSYLFILADLRAAVEHRLVRYTRGVSRILGDDIGPRPIATEVIETLRQKTRDGFLIERALLFQEGDRVRVQRGLLKDLIGIVEKKLPGEKRVQVLFKWWSTSLRASLDYRALEKAA